VDVADSARRFAGLIKARRWNSKRWPDALCSGSEDRCCSRLCR